MLLKMNYVTPGGTSYADIKILTSLFSRRKQGGKGESRNAWGGRYEPAHSFPLMPATQGGAEGGAAGPPESEILSLFIRAKC